MNDTQYILWFIGMAFAIAALLSVGILSMAGVLRRHPGETEAEHAEVHAHPRHAKDDEHHHWYDRFHHAA